MEKSERGFTLLELMIGLVIVAILAGMAVPSFSKAIEKTKVKEAQTTLVAIYSAEKIYRLDQGSYGTLDNLVTNNYITNPNTNNTNWNFTDGEVPTATTFKTTTTRTGGVKTVIVDQNFSGQPNTSPGYGGRTYAGNHDLRD